MGRKSKSKKLRPPTPNLSDHGEKLASVAVDHLASDSPPQIRRRYAPLAVCGLLLLAVLAVFGQTANHEFVNYDDHEYVYENGHVSGGLTGKGIAWAITAFYAANWHPLTWLSHMLDCQLYGLQRPAGVRTMLLGPGGHHLTNVLLHATTAIFLFLALRRMTSALWPSAWVAAVFAIHPLRVESVAWVSERKDVLSGLFFMSTLWFYARYVELPASWGRYLLVIASFALGLTAKPMLVTLPFVLLLLDYWPLGRFGSANGRVGGGFARSTIMEKGIEKKRWVRQSLHPPYMSLIVEKIPLFILAAASCVVTLAAQRDAMSSFKQLPFFGRLANAAVAYADYLGKAFYPAGLAVLYPYPLDPRPVWEAVAAVAMLLAISTAVLAVRKRFPYLVFGWLWYLGTLVPVIGLVQVGSQAMADRYTYLTQIGLFIAIAWGAMQVAGTWPYRRWGLAAVSAMAVAGLMGCAWQQTGYWRDSETLWAHTLACTSQNVTAHNSLGNALLSRGQVDEAIVHFRNALEIKPDSADAHNSLGNALEHEGQVDEAIAHYRKALEFKPDHADAHNNLGLALAERGQVDEAISHYRKALEIKPEFAEALNNLGNALAGRGQVDQAIAPSGRPWKSSLTSPRHSTTSETRWPTVG